MTQLKTFMSLIVLTAALSAKSDMLIGKLDLRNLYGNTNAGKYMVFVQVLNKDAAVVTVTQSLSESPNADQPGSEPKVCLTEFKVNAGEIKMTLSDSAKRQMLTVSKNLIFNAYHFDETEACSPVESLLNGQYDFMPYFNLGQVELNYPAPLDYQKIVGHFSVFPYGYTVKLNVSKDTNSNYIVTNLTNSLSQQLRRGNKQGLSYYISAEKESSSLSLGNGYIELR